MAPLEISLAIAAIGCALSVATFYIGRQSATRNEGKEAGSLLTALKYIKESVSRIEQRLNDDVKRLEGRIDEISTQFLTIANAATKAYESTKSSHKRIDEHLERDHNQIVAKRRGLDD